MSESEFLDWFESQYGPRPKNYDELNQEAKRLRYRLRVVEQDMEYIRMWDERKMAALYAWQAARKDKNAK